VRGNPANRLVRLVLVIAFVVLVAACGGSAESGSALGRALRPRRSRQRTLRHDPSWPQLWGPAAGQQGLVGPDHLDETRVVAGSRITGTLTVLNRGEEQSTLSTAGAAPRTGWP